MKRINRKFTLIELLVVVAIIGILVTLLLPSLGKARELARFKVCMSNQKQINTAAALYANSNDGLYVGDFNASPSTMFFATKYLPYIGGQEYTGPLNFNKMDKLFEAVGVYQCPSTKWKDVTLDYTVNSIDLQYHKKTGGYRGTWTHRISGFDHSVSGIGYIIESNNEKMHNDGSNYNLWDVFKPQAFTFNASGAPNSSNSARCFSSTDKQHLGKLNVSFFDGHSEVRILNNSSFSFGILNPYLN